MSTETVFLQRLNKDIISELNGFQWEYKDMNILKISGLFLFIILLGLTSCRSQSPVSKSIDKISATKASKQKETIAQYDKAIKRHQSIQTKDTRKRMKKDKKKAGSWSKKHIGSVPNCKVAK